MKGLYEYIYRSEFSEIICFRKNRYRLLCYDITKVREDLIMEMFGEFMVQTNSVEVEDDDPLQGISWFSGDFPEEYLHRVQSWLEKENK